MHSSTLETFLRCLHSDILNVAQMQFPEVLGFLVMCVQRIYVGNHAKQACKS